MTLDKALCYHMINLSLIPCGACTIKYSNLLALLDQLSLSSFQGWKINAQ